MSHRSARPRVFLFKQSAMVLLSGVVHTSVVCELGEATSSATVDTAGHIVTAINHEWSMKQMISWQELSSRESPIHMGQTAFELLIWEHGNIAESQRSEDVLLEVLIERQAGPSLNTESSPVYANLVQSAIAACLQVNLHHTPNPRLADAQAVGEDLSYVRRTRHIRSACCGL